MFGQVVSLTLVLHCCCFLDNAVDADLFRKKLNEVVAVKVMVLL